MEANEIAILIHQSKQKEQDFSGLQGKFQLAGVELNFTADQKIYQRELTELSKAEILHGKSDRYTVVEESKDDGNTQLRLIDGKNPDILLQTTCKPGKGMWHWADPDTLYFWRDPTQGIVSCFNGKKRTVRDLTISPEQFQFKRTPNGNVLLVSQGNFYWEDSRGNMTPLSFKLPENLAALVFCRAAEISEDQNYLVCDYLFSNGKIPFRMILCVNLQSGNYRFYAPFEFEIVPQTEQDKITESVTPPPENPAA